MVPHMLIMGFDVDDMPRRIIFLLETFMPRADLFAHYYYFVLFRDYLRHCHYFIRDFLAICIYFYP